MCTPTEVYAAAGAEASAPMLASAPAAEIQIAFLIVNSCRIAMWLMIAPPRKPAVLDVRSACEEPFI
jgi:hypothetical protein